MIGAVGIIHVESSHCGGSEGRVALTLGKILRQRASLSEKDGRAILVFEAMNQQRARRVIFEQREIVGIDLRAGREISQVRIVKQIETEESRSFIHSELLEFIMQRGARIQVLPAMQKFFRRNAGR